MQREGRTGQRPRAALQVQAVIGVAPVEAAAPGRDQAALAEPAQVVRDQVLRLARRGYQLADPLVAGGEFPQQPPPHRVSQQSHHRGHGST